MWSASVGVCQLFFISALSNTNWKLLAELFSTLVCIFTRIMHAPISAWMLVLTTYTYDSTLSTRVLSCSLLGCHQQGAYVRTQLEQTDLSQTFSLPLIKPATAPTHLAAGFLKLCKYKRQIHSEWQLTTWDGTTQLVQWLIYRLNNWGTLVRCPTEARDRFWGPPRHLFDGYLGCFTGINRPGREAAYSTLTSRLRTSGAIPQLPHTLLWHMHGLQLYTWFTDDIL